LDGNSKSIYGVGILTATTFDGSLATSNLSGTITNAQLAGSIANNKLVNDSVSYGGVSVDLGSSDATPAFDLQDATGYPYTSLTGIVTHIVGDTTPTLGGNLDANSKSIDGINNLKVTGVSTFKDDVEFHGAAGVTSAYWAQNANELRFNNDTKVKFGTGNAGLDILHDGSDSYIENSGGSAGDLYVRAQSNNKELHLQAAGAVEILTNGTEKAIMARQDGDLELYHADSLKLETTEHGIDVTGHTETDTLNVSGITTVGFATATDVWVSGAVTATSFDGSLAAANLTGTITNAQLAGSIANDKLANDSVSYGGVEVDLGAVDATPAFNLSDATNYPYTSLVL